jgi:hypothetical protein
MRIRTRRRWSWPAAGALAVVLGAPTLASAQQGGLFPNAGIRRERVPCQNEDPIYRLYRQQYFGYHPTCWRKFPDGWGCPSPEAPNATLEFQKLPRDKPPELPPEGEEPGPEEPGPMGPVRPTPGTGPGRGTTPTPSTLPPLPSGERNPFDLEKPTTPPPGQNPPAPTPPARENNPQANDTPPPATAPAAPGAGEAEATARDRRDDRDDQPLLALPDPTVNPSAGRNVVGFPLPNGEMPLPPPMPTTRPAQAPKRTSLLGDLFSGRIFRR